MRSLNRGDRLEAARLHYLARMLYRSAGRRCRRGARMMQKVCVAGSWLLVLAAALPVRAETGPCVSDQAGVMTCGQGPGAARVVDGTTSPSKRVAFAWRAPGRSPTQPPDEAGDSMFTVESLLIRLSDGAVLSSAKGEYWRTGDLQANHIDESVAWSPNSRLAIEVQEFQMAHGCSSALRDRTGRQGARSRLTKNH